MAPGTSILPQLSPGYFLGRYELLMPVAQGGMAAVWAARLFGTRGFQKVVAIKTILPALSSDSRFEQMFLDEAALAARIRHPHVVQVLDLGEQDGVLYQAMEWIDGEALSTFLRDVPDGHGLPYNIAARIMIGVCEGLHAAHETRDDAGEVVGLVHRDVSPQNILVTSDGVPKVVDFGVAKASILASSRTASGTLKGKPAYMAPEQIHGEDVDRRADIFSLGVLLYVLTTGYHPFRGENDLATLNRILSKDPVTLPSELHADYPKALEQVVLQAADKDPEKRFATAAAMARALEQALPDIHQTGNAEVAAYMHSLLGQKLEGRTTAIRKAIVEVDSRQGSAEQRQRVQTLLGMGPDSSALWQAVNVTGALPAVHPNSIPTLIGLGENSLTGAESPRLSTPGSSSGSSVIKWLGVGAVGLALLVGAAIVFGRPQTPSQGPALGASSALGSDPNPSSSRASGDARDSTPAVMPADALPVLRTDKGGRAGRDRHDAKPEGSQPTGEPSAAPPSPPPVVAVPSGSGIVVPSIRDPGF